MQTHGYLTAADVGKQLDKTAATIRMWARARQDPCGGDNDERHATIPAI